MPITATAIEVPDLQRSKSFYTDALGLECKRENVDSENRTHCHVGGEWKTEIELIEVDSEEVTPKSFGTVINDDGSQTLTVPKLHISIVIQEDLNALFDRLEQNQDCEVIQEPVVERFDGGSTHIAFVSDPDGYPLELNLRTGDDHPLPK